MAPTHTLIFIQGHCSMSPTAPMNSLRFIWFQKSHSSMEMNYCVGNLKLSMLDISFWFLKFKFNCFSSQSKQLLTSPQSHMTACCAHSPNFPISKFSATRTWPSICPHCNAASRATRTSSMITEKRGLYNKLNCIAGKRPTQDSHPFWKPIPRWGRTQGVNWAIDFHCSRTCAHWPQWVFIVILVPY